MRYLITTKTAVTSGTTYKYMGYEFTFDSALRPDVVAVSDEDAETLLEMVDAESPCCKGKGGKPLFQEVALPS